MHQRSRGELYGDERGGIAGGCQCLRCLPLVPSQFRRERLGSIAAHIRERKREQMLQTHCGPIALSRTSSTPGEEDTLWGLPHLPLTDAFQPRYQLVGPISTSCTVSQVLTVQ